MLVTGFIIAFSYQYTNESSNGNAITNHQWKQEDDLRNQVLNQQVLNRNLQEELRAIQTQVRQLEEEIADQETAYFNLVEDLEKLRMIAGQVQVKGPGLEVTLKDYSYVPEDENPNNYIVHEQHIQRVVHELLVTGAEAIAINGQRINHQSYIQCIGPVIRIDGNTSFAPFVITAIGDADKLESALNLVGGVKDQLVNDQIEVRVEKKNEIILDPYLTERG